MTSPSASAEPLGTGSPAQLPWITRPHNARFAWIAWGLLLLIVAIMVGGHPTSNTVTPNYRLAAEAMLAGRSLYPADPQQHGWLYLLPSAMLYVPFVLLPLAFGEILWRAVCVGMLAWSVRRLSVLVDDLVAGEPGARPAVDPASLAPRVDQRHFLLLTLLTLPASMGSVLNGQMNVTIGACFVLATVAIARRSWWSAAAWLALALAFKPIAIVLVLLFAALHRPLWWRTPIALAIMLASPLLAFKRAYVFEQYRAGMSTVIRAGEPGAGTFAELGSLLRAIRLEPSLGEMTVLRVAGAIGTLAASWLAIRLLGTLRGAIVTLGLGTAYLMLFNPRTEGNSYVILAPAIAAIAALLLARAYPAGGRPLLAPTDRNTALLGWLAFAACLTLGFAHLIAPGGKDRTFKPLAAAMFLTVTSCGLMRTAAKRPRV